jgi:hypothetical protein
MGTLRWEREAEESARKTRYRAEFEHKRRELQFTEARTRAQIKALQIDLQRQRAELTEYSGENKVCRALSSAGKNELRRRRGADPADSSPGKNGNGTAR